VRGLDQPLLLRVFVASTLLPTGVLLAPDGNGEPRWIRAEGVKPRVTERHEVLRQRRAPDRDQLRRQDGDGRRAEVNMLNRSEWPCRTDRQVAIG
jgi:hypothetical protein